MSGPMFRVMVLATVCTRTVRALLNGITSVGLKTDKQNCCTHCRGMLPPSLVFTTENCSETCERWPHSDHLVGNFPVNKFLSILNSTSFSKALQALGNVPLKLFPDMFNTVNSDGSGLGKEPDKRLPDRSSNPGLAGKASG